MTLSGKLDVIASLTASSTPTMKYDVVFSTDGPRQLIEAVNKRIADGWEPIGGIATVRLEADDEGPTTIFMQAIISKG